MQHGDRWPGPPTSKKEFQENKDENRERERDSEVSLRRIAVRACVLVVVSVSLCDCTAVKIKSIFTYMQPVKTAPSTTRSLPTHFPMKTSIYILILTLNFKKEIIINIYGTLGFQLFSLFLAYFAGRRFSDRAQDPNPDFK